MRYITWYLPGGKAVTRSLGPAHSITITHAKAILSRMKLDAKRKHIHDPFLSNYVPEYIKYARDIQQKRSWKRDEIALNHIVKSLGECHLSQITSDKLIEYQGRRLKEGAKNGTINLELTYLKRLYNVANLQDKFNGKNPVNRVKYLKQTQLPDRILTLEEQRRLLAAAPPYLKEIIIFALDTGMRLGEILTLKWENVNLAHRYCLLESSLTKTSRQRRVPINSELADMMEEMKSKKKSDYVFTNSYDRGYKSNPSLRNIFQITMQRASIENFRFHDLRHTAATRMVEVGVPLFTVGQILGHVNPKTTMRYAHPEKSLRDGLEALGRYNRDNDSDTKKKIF